MAGKADAFLKICTAVSLLGAAGSVGYYYSIYLPARDSLLDRERQLDKAHAEFAARAAADRAKAEKDASEQKAGAEKTLAQMNCDSCIARAGEDYSRTWAFNCKQIAERAQKARAGCTSDKSFLR